MRNPDRIPVLIGRLRRVWEANPDLRLGQMVINAARERRAYSIEDEELLDLIESTHAQAQVAPVCGVSWCGSDSTGEVWERCFVRNRRCYCSVACAERLATRGT